MAIDWHCLPPPPGQADAAARALVLDTQIVLDLLLFADPGAAPLRRLLAAGRLQWLATRAMRAELERVLAYPQIVRCLALRQISAAQVLADYDAGARCVAAAPSAVLRCQDADDQPFIDLALAHRAILLSKDKAVLRLRKSLLALGVCTATAIVGAAPAQAQ